MAAICQFTPISYPEKHSIKITYNKLGYVIWRIYTTLRKSTLVLGSCWFEIGVLSDQHHLILHFLYLFICLSTIWWFHEITIDFFCISHVMWDEIYWFSFFNCGNLKKINDYIYCNWCLQMPVCTHYYMEMQFLIS